MPLCVICDERDATSKCITCQRCRAYIHRWGGEKPDRLMTHFGNIGLRLRLLSTFAVVKDEDVRYIDEQELLHHKIMFASKLKRKATAVIVSMKQAARLQRSAHLPITTIEPITEELQRRSA